MLDVPVRLNFGADGDKLINILADDITPKADALTAEQETDVVDWAEHYFYIEERADPVTGENLGPGTIILAPFQRRILRAALARDERGRFKYSTIVWSAPKKSGKTRIAAMVGAWGADTLGDYGEVYCVANTGEQSADRILGAVKKAVEIGLKHAGRETADWVQKAKLTIDKVLFPNGSRVEALPVNASGAAGSNPTIVIFSELWGFGLAAKERMWCYDQETQILTDEGWKLIGEVTEKERVATLSRTTGAFEWELPRSWNVTSYSGPMHRVTHRSVDLLVTPGHTIYGKFATVHQAAQSGDWRSMPVEEAATWARFWPKTTADQWVGDAPEGDVVIPGTVALPEIRLAVKPFVRLLAWYLAEGSLSRPGSVQLSQSRDVNPEKYQEIWDLCLELGLRPRQHGDGHTGGIWLNDRRLVVYFSQFGKSQDKWVPRWVLDLPSEYLEAFLDVYKRADGTQERTRFKCSTVSSCMVSALSEIGIKLGYRVSVQTYHDKRSPLAQYTVRFIDPTLKPVCVDRKQWSVEMYEGLVWCPSTTNGVVLVRRGNYVGWCGNTETTISPARRGRSFRFVDSYAGFTGESPVLERLYEAGFNHGRPLEGFEDLLGLDGAPVVRVNDGASIFCYWDSVPRMPWQEPAYYEEEAHALTDSEFRRIHQNQWVRPTESFVPIEWWDANTDHQLPILVEGEKMILGVDAGWAHDSFAIVGVTRHPKRPNDVAVRYVRVWYPRQGIRLDFDCPDGADCNNGPRCIHSPNCEIRRLCKSYRILEVAYDETQLHYMATQHKRLRVANWQMFKASKRPEADGQLYHLIRDGRVLHNGNVELRAHVEHCNAKYNEGQGTRLLLEKGNRGAIDAAVSLSMAADRCLYLRM